MTATQVFTVKATPPFDFDLSARIFSGGDRQISNYENGKFWQVIRLDEKPTLIAIKSSGTVEQPKLSVKLTCDQKISDTDKRRAAEIIGTLFNLNFDLNPFYEEAKNDKVMAELTRRMRGLKSPTTQTAFEALVDSIVEQQISLNVAGSMERKLIKAFGDTLRLKWEVYYAFPTPRNLASASSKQLRQCGLSLRKIEYIKEISKLIADGKLELEKFKKYESAKEIVKELDEIRGIGVWTAEMTMVRGMQKLDAMPADDLGLRRIISRYYCKKRRITSEEARKTAENWGRWKGLASFYLYVASVLGIEVQNI